VWKHKYPSGGFGNSFPGLLSTAGKLLFTGDPSGNLLAYDPAGGRILWALPDGHDGQQRAVHVYAEWQSVRVGGAGDTLFAFKLAGVRNE